MHACMPPLAAVLVLTETSGLSGCVLHRLVLGQPTVPARARRCGRGWLLCIDRHERASSRGERRRRVPELDRCHSREDRDDDHCSRVRRGESGHAIQHGVLYHFIDGGPFLWRCCFLLGAACDSRTLGCSVAIAPSLGTTYALGGARGRSGQVTRSNRASKAVALY